MKTGNKLIPLKGFALYVAGILTPFLNWIVLKYSSFDTILIVLGTICLTGAFACYFLKTKYKW